MTAPNQKTELVHRVARRRRRQPQRVRALITLAGLLTVGYFSYVPVQHAINSLFTGADQSFVTYRLLSERDALLAANQRLQEELEDLQAKTVPTGTTFEASVRAQLDELQGIITAATQLDLGEDGPTIARKGKKGKKRDELASTLKSAGSGASRGGSRPPMGGKEIECEDGQCTRFIRKKNISLEIGPSFFEPQRDVQRPDENSVHSPTESDLLRRIAVLSQGLRALPIGYPAEGDITSHYGYRLSPFSRRASFHEGMDLSLRTGGDVVATGDGVVTEAKYDRAYGWVVDVEHSPNVVTRYAHLSKIIVKEGQEVSRGDRIALSGNTGRSTGPHLHYEVRVNGRAQNPKQFVLLAGRLATVF